MDQKCEIVKKYVIIAGPNGAGKTTFATAFLANEVSHPIFLNADLIAAKLNPSQPAAVALSAGRLMIKTIRDLVERGENFAFETTLSGLGYARSILKWQVLGYHVKIFFLKLPSPDIAVARVQRRVSKGGHDIPEPVVYRRFHAGWDNFENVYRNLVDEWMIFENAGPNPVLIAEGRKPMKLHKSDRQTSVEQTQDSQMSKAEIALRRAVKDVYREAAINGDRLPIYENDKVVWIVPILESEDTVTSV